MTDEIDVLPDAEEAARWYLRVCGSEHASPAQDAQARLELAHLFMSQEKYDVAAHYFYGALNTYPEVIELQRVCEVKAEAQFQARMQRDDE